MHQTEIADRPGRDHLKRLLAESQSSQINRFTVATEPAFDFTSGEFRNLFDRSAATAFQHPEWLDALYLQLAPAFGAEPLVITVRNALNGELEMVLPLIKRRILGFRVIEFADLGVTDYASPVATLTAFEAIAGDEEARDALQMALGQHDILRIKHVRRDGMNPARLFDQARSTPMPFCSHALALETSFDVWRTTGLNKKLRKKITRRRKALAEIGKLQYTALECPKDITNAFNWMRKFRKPRFASTPGEDLTQNEIHFNFYLDMAIKGQAAGFARTSVVELDGQPIAVLFGLRDYSSFLPILLGADIENHGRNSPGFLIYEDAIRHSMADGDRSFDFTIGDEAFKQRYGTKATPIDVVWSSGTALGKAASAMNTNFKWVTPMFRHFVRPI